ncbi:MAG: spheroidene monooxygenase [Pseudomonadota bacterium]
MMGLARPFMAATPEIGFWKLCGSGTGEGFTPVPNTAVYAILATWPDATSARLNTERAQVFRWYRRQAVEAWTVFLCPVSVRGAWSGVAPFQAEENKTAAGAKRLGGAVAALTRATVRPRKALRFWRRVPDISDVIGDDPNVAFKIGIGEVPLLHQVTFSIWPDTQSMARFARHDGPHARAIQAVRSDDWFREELYARFQVVGDRGTWEGKRPLERLEHAL